MDGDYFTVMGLISALNDLAVMSSRVNSSFIKTAFCLPTSSIIHLIVDVIRKYLSGTVLSEIEICTAAACSVTLGGCLSRQMGEERCPSCEPPGEGSYQLLPVFSPSPWNGFFCFYLFNSLISQGL